MISTIVLLIFQARDILVKAIPNWKEDTIVKIKHDIEMRDTDSHAGIADRLAKAKSHAFHHLLVTDSNLSNLYTATYNIEDGTSQVPNQLSQQSDVSTFSVLDDMDL